MAFVGRVHYIWKPWREFTAPQWCEPAWSHTMRLSSQLMQVNNMMNKLRFLGGAVMLAAVAVPQTAARCAWP